MSKVVKSFLHQNPLLTHYLQMGLINVTSLAEHIKETSSSVESDASIASIAMAIRRYLAQLPKEETYSSKLNNLKLHLVSRSHLTELIFDKTEEKRKFGRQLFQNISKT